jgi:hypothetical protein
VKYRQFFTTFIFIVALFGLVESTFSQKSVPKSVVKKKKVIKKKATLPLICGKVYLLKGNQMPDPDKPMSKGAVVSREIQIYTLTKRTDTEGDGATFFSKINTKLIKKFKSDKKGMFCVNLPAGKYSIFVLDPGFGLFANNFDGEMNISPIEIVKGKNKDIELQINHSAAF